MKQFKLCVCGVGHDMTHETTGNLPLVLGGTDYFHIVTKQRYGEKKKCHMLLSQLLPFFLFCLIEIWWLEGCWSGHENQLWHIQSFLVPQPWAHPSLNVQCPTFPQIKYVSSPQHDKHMLFDGVSYPNSRCYHLLVPDVTRLDTSSNTKL